VKTEITNVDVYVGVKELQELINGKLDKAFLVDSQDGKELILKLHVPEVGTREVAIGIGKYKYITLTEYPREKPKNPPSFAMLLRKHLKNIKITKIEQHNFDRIVKFAFQWGERTYTLVVELFGEGNIILLDNEDRIILPLKIEKWSTRKIVPKEIYKFPPQRNLTPFNLEYTVAYEIFKDEFGREDNKNTECVRVISRIFGLAGMYAEEICEMSNVDKKTINPNEEDLKKLFEGTKAFFNKMFNEKKPQIILKNGEYYDVSPIELIKYNSNDYDKKYYDKFINAMDDYFSRFILKKEIKKEETKLQKIVKRQERILNNQIESLKKYEKQAEENQIKGDLVYANYNLVDEILNTLKSAREKMDWKSIKKIIKENKDNPVLSKIVSINEKNGEIVLKLSADYGDGLIEKNVVLDIRKNAFENADEYYNKSKKFKNKIKGVKTAIELSKQKLEKLRKKEEMEIEALKEIEEKSMVKKERKKRKWYEKFKWTVINNYLIVAGKDATTNEMLIKRYTEKDDIVFHTQMEGSPFTVIKVGSKKLDELTDEEREFLLSETAKFAVSHSKAWKIGLGSADVYWVKPEQISKTAESGEYLKKGAFMVRGKRNYIRSTPLELGVGIIEYDGEDKLTTAPPETLKNFKKYVLLKPAKKKKGELIRELKKEFSEYSVDDEDILRVLPPGESEIMKKK
jgi:predicted ribosome quality control (RQC) complex YloA/Tae2 family protein